MLSPITTLITKAQREACLDAIRGGLSVCRIPPPLSLSEWADANFYLSAESSAIEGPWKSLPFQRDILDCIGNDDVRIIDWLKCARIGYTKCLMAATGYFCAYKKRNGVIYQPVDGDAEKFSKVEVDPMIRDCKAVRDAFRGHPDRRGPYNTLDLKQFVGATLYIRGGKSGKAYRAITCDWVFYDELEAFDRDIDEEGDAVSLGDARISNSPFPKSVRGSTPRLKHDSLISGEVERARHKFRFRVPCPECGGHQALQFGSLRWDKGAPETVRYECEFCSEPIHYSDLGLALAGGWWSTDEGFKIENGGLIDPDGLAVDWPRHIAFHIWAGYSPFFTWQELIEEWLEAVAAQRGGDIRKLKSFTNTRLAEAWEEHGEQVAYDALYARRESYTRPPRGALVLTAQFDVQDNRLEGEVIAWGRGEESWGVEYRVLYGDPTQIEVWNELEAVINQRFTTDDGRELPIAAVVVDSGHLADHVYSFWDRTAHPRVFCSKGVGGTDKPIVSAPHTRKSGRSAAPVPLYLMGADVCKSIVYRRLAIAGPGAGYCHFPDTYDEEYFRALTAEKRITRHRRGFEVVEWIKTRPRNEALDVRAMGIFAIALLNPVWDALDPDNAPPPTDEGPAPAINPYAQRRSNIVRQPRGFVRRWPR